MKDKKNIDRLFQEKFRDFEVGPAEEVWKNIKGELHDQKNKRNTLFPLWTKIGGLAALLALLFLVGKAVFFTAPNSTSVVKSSTKKTEEYSPQNHSRKSQSEKTNLDHSIGGDTSGQRGKKGYAGEEPDNVLNEKGDALQAEKNSDTENPAATEGKGIASGDAKNKERQKEDEQAIKLKKESSKNKMHSRASIAQVKGGVERICGLNNDIRAHLLSSADVQSLHLNSRVKKSPPDPIAESDALNQEQERPSLQEIADNKNQSEKEHIDEVIRKNRFSIRPNMAPIFYNSTGGGSPVDPKFNDNAGQGETTMAYGVNLAYAVSKRFKIRTGVSRVNMGYKTTDVAVTSSAKLLKLQGLRVSSKGQHVAIMKSTADLKTEQSELQAYGIPYDKGNLNQKYEYLEVPFEVEFALLDERFGINLIGGFSTLFLNNDQINIVSSIGKMELGQANNLNTVSFTTNFGVGFDYNLSKWLIFNVEPTFKYQLNGFSGDTGSFHPYYFGIYTGLSFRF